MVSIVIVSHNHLLAEGLKQLALEMTRDGVKIATAGGVDEATMGTNAERIYQAIQEVYTTDGVLILFDLGGALFSTQMAIEMLPAERRKGIKLSRAPIVEGTLVAVVEASLGHNLEEVNAAAEAAQHVEKILL
jgi:phosphocarrier protein FPr